VQYFTYKKSGNWVDIFYTGCTDANYCDMHCHELIWSKYFISFLYICVFYDVQHIFMFFHDSMFFLYLFAVSC